MCAHPALPRMEEKAKVKKYQFSFPANISKKVDIRVSTLSTCDKRQISCDHKKLLDPSYKVSDSMKENELKNRNRPVCVSKSVNYGLGLFAAEDIEGGQFLLGVCGGKNFACDHGDSREALQNERHWIFVSVHARQRLHPQCNTPRFDRTVHKPQLQFE